MKPLDILERLLDWLDEKFFYNCNKERHKWVYNLSDVGCVYLDEKKVPEEAWYCEKCGIKKHN